MRGKTVHHLYLTEQEAHVLSNFFITVTNLVGNERIGMMELLGIISSDGGTYDKYGQVIDIHYND